MLTILASYAHEESLSVSENCKWKIRHNFENGIANTFSLYGYKKVNGEIRIKEDEAEVVREIFWLYLLEPKKQQKNCETIIFRHRSV